MIGCLTSTEDSDWFLNHPVGAHMEVSTVTSCCSKGGSATAVFVDSADSVGSVGVPVGSVSPRLGCLTNIKVVNNYPHKEKTAT